MRLSVIFGSLVLLFVCPAATLGQKVDESDPRAMIQANFLYQFAANCNWPAEVLKGKFTFAVMGQPDVFDHLAEKYGTKPIGNQTIDVVELAELPTIIPHILFIDKSRKSELAQALRDFRGKPTLLVTNWDGALQAGAHINFKAVDGNIRYELNVAALDEKKIAAGVKILQWKVD